jgi:signal transduction histidine kinase
VRVWAKQELLRVQAEGRGAGFDVKGGQYGGVGLTGMRQRANIVGGRLTVVSSPGAGRHITATYP